MIASRRCPSAIRLAARTAVSPPSGPRCRSVSGMRVTVAWSAGNSSLTPAPLRRCRTRSPRYTPTPGRPGNRVDQAAPAARVVARGRPPAVRSGARTPVPYPRPRRDVIPMPPIAYLTDHYPAVSHTFIQREALALRRRGVDVRTFSIHRVGTEHLLSGDDRAAFATTESLLPVGAAALIAAHAAALARHPRAYLAALRDALRLPAESPRGRLWQLFYFAEAVLLWRACRRAGIRHVHAHFTTPAADVTHQFARFARRAWRGKATWSFSAHGVDIDVADQSMLAEKVRDADLVVCVSDFGRSRLMALVDEQHWGKLHVVRCGVDLRAFPPAPRSSGATFSILCVGRLVAIKAHGVLLEAVAALVAAGVDAHLTLVGDGPRREALEALVRDRRLADRVRFAGRVGQDEIGAFYRAADIFCLPSFAEGVPVVLMEAMASGLPVVSTRVNGIPELVEDGVSGLLVAPGRSDLLAEALRTLADDAAYRAELGDAGRARVAASFEVDACAEQLAGRFAAFS